MRCPSPTARTLAGSLERRQRPVATVLGVPDDGRALHGDPCVRLEAVGQADAELEAARDAAAAQHSLAGERLDEARRLPRQPRHGADDREPDAPGHAQLARIDDNGRVSARGRAEEAAHAAAAEAPHAQLELGTGELPCRLDQPAAVPCELAHPRDGTRRDRAWLGTCARCFPPAARPGYCAPCVG